MRWWLRLHSTAVLVVIVVIVVKQTLHVHPVYPGRRVRDMVMGKKQREEGGG